MLRTLKKIGAGILLGAGLLLYNPVYSQQNINIHGTVTGIPNNNKVNGAKVVAVRADNGARVDSTYTNSNGYYNMDFIWTGTQNHETLDEKIFPNPCSNERTLAINALLSDNYTLRIFNANGQLVLNENIPLSQGGNNVTLNGGQAGIYLITLTNGTEKKIYKSIQTESTGAPIQYNITSTGTPGPILKSGLEDILTVGDEVRLELTYPNTNPKDSYNPKDTTFIVAPNQTINQQMQQIAYILNATLKPYLDDGKPVTTLAPGWTTTFEFPAPLGTKTYTPNGNNEIVIQEELFPLNGALGNVTIHHDTSNYTVNSTINGVLSWIVLRAQNQSTAVRNPVQTSSIDLIPEATTTASLDSLDGRTLNYYTLPKKAETQPGTWYRMDHTLVLGFMLSSGDGLETSKFIDIPPYGHVVLMKTVYDTDPNQFPTQANMDRAINEYNKAINLCVMNNNDNITQPTQFFYTNMNDSIWTAVQSRSPPMDNTLVLTFRQSSPSVTRTWANTYTYDGESRLSYTKAKYSESATDGQIFEENYSATYGIEEGSGGLAPYVYIGTTGQPTDLAGRMGRWVKILDLGSGNSKKSGALAPKTQENENATIEKAPVYETTTSSASANFEYNYVSK